MTRGNGNGGWVLELRCTGCDASDTFRGVLLTFAGDRAIEAGWHVENAAEVLVLPPRQRDELCPKCVASLAG